LRVHTIDQVEAVWMVRAFYVETKVVWSGICRDGGPSFYSANHYPEGWPHGKCSPYASRDHEYLFTSRIVVPAREHKGFDLEYGVAYLRYRYRNSPSQLRTDLLHCQPIAPPIIASGDWIHNKTYRTTNCIVRRPIPATRIADCDILLGLSGLPEGCFRPACHRNRLLYL